MISKLSDISYYAVEKISVSELNNFNYISTENMLPYKGGITQCASLPKIKSTQAFKTGDVLVSNIRPYFKKVWFAEFDGGCSNDVLVFRAKENVDNRFLHYILSCDSFFDYAMATAKGTKMPRGDKNALMSYQIPDIGCEEQKKISGILTDIDQKICLNTAINDNLAA